MGDVGARFIESSDGDRPAASVLAKIVVRRTAMALLWAIAIPLVIGLAAAENGWPGWVGWGLAAAALGLASYFKPPMSITLARRPGLVDGAGAMLVVRRWGATRAYTLHDIQNIQIDRFKVAVPVVHLTMSDGWFVGPLLKGPEGEDFFAKLASEMRAEDVRDPFLWRQLDDLRAYFERAAS